MEISRSGKTRFDVHRIAVFPTTLGWIATAWLDEALCALSFGHKSYRQAAAALRLPENFLKACRLDMDSADRFAQRMRAYAQGNLDDFQDVPVVFADLTRFQQRVLRQCRQIPYGSTVTYRELAARAGSPNAARAVGRVMAKNPIALVIPCHRVVAAGGGLGGYSAPMGLRMKQQLLDLERAVLQSRSPGVQHA